MKKNLKIITISDVHLGNERNTTDFILNNLYTFFREQFKRKDLDGIFIGGDLFDRQLSYNSVEGQDIAIFIAWFIEQCALRDILVRILKGTPSHDCDQNSWIETIASMQKLPIRLKYVKDLCLEYIPEWDFNILYIPDEWTNDTDLTYKQVLKLLKENNLHQVDFILMHGQFDFQIPPELMKIPRHLSENYKPLARYFVSVGHIHTPKFLDNIIGQGSFDRMAHNEEEPKGAVEFNMKVDGSKSFTFIENKTARIFKTIHIKHKDVDKTYKYLEKQFLQIPNGSFIRLRLSKDHPIVSSFDQLKLKYPLYKWSKIIEGQEESPTQSTFIETQLIPYEATAITPENITGLVSTRLHSLGYLESDIISLTNILSKVI